MILLLGGTGYIGRGQDFVALARKDVDYTRFEVLLKFLRERKPEFVVNAAGYTGKPNVDACELHKADTLQGNTLFPATVAHACAAAGVPWGHVSSGCIYAGAKVVEGGKTRAEKDFTKPEWRDSRLHRDGHAELFLPRFAVQFLQRHEGARRGSHCGHWPELHLATADSV
jgi:dTDP-4-dehydrorhamnose reductase